MGKGLYPDLWVRSAYDIDYEGLMERGLAGVIFDIDNTLVLPDEPCDDRARALFAKLHGLGLKTCILSNNTGKRASDFAGEAGSPVVTGALKPFPGKYREAVEKLGLLPSQVFFVGDQIYTDIWGANNAGLFSVLTVPFTYKEEPQIVLKRKLEKPVIAGLKKRFKAPLQG